MSQSKDQIEIQETLTPQQERFCQEYIVDLNGTQAAIRSKYSEDSAGPQAARLLTKANIKKRIAKLQLDSTIRAQITADAVLSEMYRLATVDISQAYDPLTGKLLPLNEIPDECRRAIAGVESFEEHEGFGKDRIYIGETIKVKFYDKTKALEMLAKHLKLLTELHEHEVKGSLADLLAASWRPVTEVEETQHKPVLTPAKVIEQKKTKAKKKGRKR
jgi:phage terminase small subunit